MKDKKVKITWLDAITYTLDYRTKNLSKMVTTGTIVKEDKDFVIVSKPKTISVKTNKKYPSGKTPTFFFIPKGMIKTLVAIK